MNPSPLKGKPQTSVQLRTALANLCANAQRYFRKEGFLPRVAHTAARAAFIAAVTYAAFLGVIFGYLIWAVNSGEIDANQLAGEFALQWNQFSSVVQVIHLKALQLAGLVAGAIVLMDVFLPRSKQMYRAAHNDSFEFDSPAAALLHRSDNAS